MSEAKRNRSRRAAAPKNSPKTKPATKERTVTPINEGLAEEYAARNARIGATLDLQDIPDSERAFLAICQKIHRRERGCDSPFEEFFADMVFEVERGAWPTPDDVATRLEQFREHFEFMRESARNFIEAYPETLAAQEPEHGA